jgi:hypothetical protein
MRISVGRLRHLFAEAMAEARIAAHPDYMKKERVREHLQKHLMELVSSGEIKSQEDLESFWSTCDMAAKALKVVPFDVWSKMSGKPTAKKR